MLVAVAPLIKWMWFFYFRMFGSIYLEGTVLFPLLILFILLPYSVFFASLLFMLLVHCLGFVHSVFCAQLI